MPRLHLVLGDPSGFEKNLDKLARIPIRFEDRDIIPIQMGIVAGFAQNFDEEASGGFPWPPLARRTLEERDIEGFPYPEHPMLVRTGRYRRSWVNLHDHLHFHRHFVSWDSLFIEEGSSDPRVPTLSGGDWMHSVPERPVEELDDAAINRLDIVISHTIRVKQRSITFEDR